MNAAHRTLLPAYFTDSDMFDSQAVQTASQCRHYAMCKIDFLGIGICPPGRERHFASFYPQGRMDIYYGLSQGRIPLTKRLIEIAGSCTECGICDKQCYFITGMRPRVVMRALKDVVRNATIVGRKFVEPPGDEVLRKLKAITGPEWSSNDPADMVAYAEDPSPLARFTLPKYVVLPGSEQEVADIMRLCRDYRLAWKARGNGSNTMGQVISEGLILDLRRMQAIEFDLDNWSVAVEPGVSAFELQKEALARGCRVSTAESSALVCANMICSGFFSLFSASYGTMADNVIDARFVSETGDRYRLNDRNQAHFYAFFKEDRASPGVCTRATIRLHPKLEDEEGVLVPFAGIDEALPFVRELNQRRIGTAIGLLGPGYVSSFLSATTEMDNELRPVLTGTFGLEAFLLVIGTAHDVAYVRSRAHPVIDQSQFASFMLGLPGLLKNELHDLIQDYEGGTQLFRFIFQKELFPFLEAALNPSPALYAQTVDPDFQPFFESLYSRPEMTDLVWLNAFRILSPRMGRKKPFFALILYVPMDKPDLIRSIIDDFSGIGNRNHIDHEFGFLTPLDQGRRAVLEYDFHHEFRNEHERENILRAAGEAGAVITRLSASNQGITWIRHIVNQGFARKEPMLYGRYETPQA